MPIDQSKLPREFLEAIADSLERHGKQVMRRLLQDKPETFRSLVESVLNKEEAIRFGLAPTAEQLDWLAERVVARIRHAMEDEGKPTV
jgi:hypothetical protein